VLLGVISYGVYLWHFPIDVFATPGRIGLSGVPLMGVQFGLTVAVATVSYVAVERPVMAGTFWRSLRAVVPAGAGVATTAVVICAATVVPAQAGAQVRHYAAPAGAGTGTSPPPEVAIAGCGLAVAANSSNETGHLEEAMFPGCNEDQPAAQRWPARDAAAVAGLGPGDVVLFLAGEWETQDLLRHGHWTDILHPSFLGYLRHQLRTLVSVATAGGAHLDLLTMPAMEAHGEFGHTGVMDRGPPNPSSTPRRRALYNGLLRQAAAEHPGQVSLLRYGTLLSPHGTFTEHLDGVQVRATDGIHTPAYEAGNGMWSDTTPTVADEFYRWLSPRLWPAIDASAHGGPSPGPLLQLSAARP
jgi:hypothetical protein